MRAQGPRSRDVVLRAGINGCPVVQVFLRQTKSKVADPSGSGYSDLEEWVLDTEGVNLAEVCNAALCWLLLELTAT